ncbi:hypothetical protein AAC387_Pa03g4499 [Persea americana]
MGKIHDHHARRTHVGQTLRTSAVARPFTMRSTSEVARICVRPYATLIHLALSPSVMRTGSVSYVSSVDYPKHEDIQVTDDDEGDQLQEESV